MVFRSARILVVFAIVLLSGCDRGPERVVLRGATMGTTWSVIYRSGAAVAPDELQARIETELQAINAALSTYIADSEISRLNNATGDFEGELSERFATVLDEALEIGRITGGAYDVTVGPLIELWGFGAEEFSATVPAAAAIAQARGAVGAGRLDWDTGSRTLRRPAGMSVDLSSIAKGYAVDRLSELLAERGVANSLVEIGGELRASGERPEGGAWRLAVESPDPSEQRFVEALSLNNAAVATSGDYRNYFEVDGKRYSHLVDPRTGYPVSHELVSVTVIDRACMTADALATALIVMGLDDGLALARSRGIAAHFVTREKDGLAVHYTDEFDVYRQASVDAARTTAEDEKPAAREASTD